MVFACIFCGEKISSDDAYEIKLTKFKTKKESEVGRTYCHIKCFVSKVKKEYTFVRKLANSRGSV